MWVLVKHSGMLRSTLESTTLKQELYFVALSRAKSAGGEGIDPDLHLMKMS